MLFEIGDSSLGLRKRIARHGNNLNAFVLNWVWVIRAMASTVLVRVPTLTPDSTASALMELGLIFPEWDADAWLQSRT